MYLKIFFIGVNLIPIIPFFKISILFFSSTLFFILNERFRPFIYKELNVLELYSLLSVSLTIFTGAFFVSNIDGYFEDLCFAFIILLNTVFCSKCLLAVLRIILPICKAKIIINFPKLTSKMTFVFSKFLSLIKKIRRKCHLKRVNKCMEKLGLKKQHSNFVNLGNILTRKKMYYLKKLLYLHNFFK